LPKSWNGRPASTIARGLGQPERGFLDNDVGYGAHAAILRAASVATSRTYAERDRPRLIAAARSLCFSSGETLTLMPSIIAVTGTMVISQLIIVRIYQRSNLLPLRIFGKVPHHPQIGNSEGTNADTPSHLMRACSAL